jgi:hypothetical protein
MFQYFRRRRARLASEQMFQRYGEAYSPTVQALVEDTVDRFDSLSRDELILLAAEMYGAAVMAILAFADVRGSEIEAPVAAEGARS